MIKENIKLIVGLGNPGDNYKKNRHNIGFRVIDRLAEKYNSEFKKKDNFKIAHININNNISLIKPETFMNNSGQISFYLKKNNILAKEILVIHDDLELDFGKIVFKFGGSSKGHNGLKSIINYIGHDFWRLRFGISRPEDKSQVPNYVLQNFNKEQELAINDLIEKSIDLIIEKFY